MKKYRIIKVFPHYADPYYVVQERCMFFWWMRCNFWHNNIYYHPVCDTLEKARTLQNFLMEDDKLDDRTSDFWKRKEVILDNQD